MRHRLLTGGLILATGKNGHHGRSENRLTDIVPIPQVATKRCWLLCTTTDVKGGDAQAAPRCPVQRVAYHSRTASHIPSCATGDRATAPRLLLFVRSARVHWRESGHTGPQHGSAARTNPGTRVRGARIRAHGSPIYSEPISRSAPLTRFTMSIDYFALCQDAPAPPEAPGLRSAPPPEAPRTLEMTLDAWLLRRTVMPSAYYERVWRGSQGDSVRSARVCGDLCALNRFGVVRGVDNASSQRVSGSKTMGTKR
jgi:hypothetical protein